eukprot:CAMPEP_0183716076 /NCGR_PEP_ID=MMETSP0737-20130205/10100_1 /TAXON_ID=385413 /ORGANISM="Thalassiosira miniscula, Strain CCMP1093" /LENGTH=640 /DNA_ID=CAMNT_0025945285 /DNA_START=1 /DNA_END=1920 /DNA_ORIENTATION=+
MEQLLFREHSSSFIVKTKRAWAFVLGLSAFAELLSFVLPYYFFPDDGAFENDVPESSPLPPFIFSLPSRQATVDPNEDDKHNSAIQWLDDNCYHIGVIFNCFWTIHCLVRATETRHKAHREVEKNMLLRSDESSTATDSKKKKKKPHLKALIEEKALSFYAFGGSWGVFFAMVFLLVLLLPAGFFIQIAHKLKLYESAVEGKDSIDELYAITKTTKYCLGYVLLVRCYKNVSLAASAYIEALRKRALKFLAIFAIRRPLTFRRRLRKTLAALRWIKYIAPLIATGNKLREALRDLQKRHRQKKDAKQAKMVKKLLWEQATPDQRRERAALAIQRNYRGYRRRRSYRAMCKIRARRVDAATLAATIKIQAKLRQRAVQARANVLRKKKELEMLRIREYYSKGIGKKTKGLRNKSKRRMYQLEDELLQKVKKIKDRKMLLRPNTRFSFYWRGLFSICLILEITYLALEPRVAKYRGVEIGSMGMVLEHYLVPDPINEWPQCQSVFSFESNQLGVHVDTWRIPKKKKRKENKSGGDDAAGQPPWYCYKPFANIQKSFASLLRYIIKHLLVVISIICFMDVFVTFFTGEICPETGCLQPKPFVERWLVPGLILQLLLNPMMVEVSAAIGRLWTWAHHIGPARVW